jgi:hypothetical protein
MLRVSRCEFAAPQSIFMRITDQTAALYLFLSFQPTNTDWRNANRSAYVRAHTPCAYCNSFGSGGSAESR